jgi:hypothetical protein
MNAQMTGKILHIDSGQSHGVAEAEAGLVAAALPKSRYASRAMRAWSLVTDSTCSSAALTRSSKLPARPGVHGQRLPPPPQSRDQPVRGSCRACMAQ